MIDTNSVREVIKKASDQEANELVNGKSYIVNCSGQDRFNGLDQFESMLRKQFGEDYIAELEITIIDTN